MKEGIKFKLEIDISAEELEKWEPVRLGNFLACVTQLKNHTDGTFLERFERSFRAMDDNYLFMQIVGALKATIKDHGDIGKKEISSAAKRIFGALRGEKEG